MRLARRVPPHSAPRASRRGQALVELSFVVVIFMFVGMMGYETGVMYHNVNAVENGLKQAAWMASMGAQDEAIMATIANVDTYMMKSAWFDHRTEKFSIEVYIHDTNGAEFQIAPTQWDLYLTPAAANRAAYIWRANGMNIRMGLTYVAGYVAPYMGAEPLFRISLPLVASMPIAARNDEDMDGMVDLYEQELFVGVRTGVGVDSGWIAQCHRDTGWYSSSTASDRLNADIDGDSVSDMSEAGYSRYDYNNDGLIDPWNRGPSNNLSRHPIIGGRPLTGLP